MPSHPNLSAIAEKWAAEPWMPVVRFGTVLDAKAPIHPDQAYKLGELAYANHEKIMAPFFANEAKRQLRALGVNNVDIQSPSGDQPKLVRYQLTPTIILSYLPVSLKGPWQFFGRRRSTNIECRMSLTICPDETKSKLWLRFCPSENLPLEGCRNFFQRVGEIEAELRTAILSNYNKAVVSTINNELEEYFQISVGICTTKSIKLGKIIRDEVMHDRSALSHRDEDAALHHHLKKLIRHVSPIRDHGNDLRKHKQVTSLYWRDVGRGISAEEEEAETPIYVAGEIDIYDTAAEVVGIAYDPKSSGDGLGSASLIASAELATELGAAY